jgi:hypothetical protein
VYASNGGAITVIGRNGAGKTDRGVKLSPAADRVDASELAFARPQGSSITWDDVLSAYLSDADAFAAAHPDATALRPMGDVLVPTRAQLIAQYCAQLSEGVRAALQNLRKSEDTQEGWNKVSNEELACFGDDPEPWVVGGQLMAYGCNPGETQVWLDAYFIGTPFSGTTNYVEQCHPPTPPT